MKTGRVAKMFERDSKTIIKWIDMFPDFFTPEAKGQGGNQRDFLLDDLIAINTIKILVAGRHSESDIQAKMTSGFRETQLPPEFVSLEGTKALAVYTEMSALKSANFMQANEIKQLREQLNEKEKALMEKSEEIGKWKALYNMLKEQDNNSK